MAQLQYIGARYVPKYYQNSVDPSSSEWEPGKVYEALTVVTWNDVSYTSKIPVPANIGAPDLFPAYWAKNADMPAAIHALQEEISDIKNGDLNDNSIAYSKLNDRARAIIEENAKIIFMPNTLYPDNFGVNNGACTVFVTKFTKQVIMLDSGRSDSYDAINAELIKNNIEHIDYFILSHYHGDHFTAIPYLKADGYIDNSTIAYLPRDTDAVDWSDNQALVRSYFASNTVVTIDSTNPLTVDDMKFDFFNCDADDFEHYESAGETSGNVYCVGTYITIGNFTMLSCGDMFGSAIAYMQSLNKFKHCNVINVPHHGISNGAQTYLMYMRVRPDVAVMEAPAIHEYKHEYENDGLAYGVSSSIACLNAMNIPVYSSGYGAIYVGVSDNEYSLISNDKKVYSSEIENLEINVYVDDKYEGITYGTHEQPFNTVHQALAYIDKLDSLKLAKINIVGTYIHDDEQIYVSDSKHYIQIVGTMDDTNYNVKVKNIRTLNATVLAENIEFYRTDGESARAQVNSVLYLVGCKLSGDTTDMADNWRRPAMMSEFGCIIDATNCIVNDKNIIAYLQDGGDIILDSVSGSNNLTLISGEAGGKFDCRNIDSLAYTTFVAQRESAIPPCDSIKYNNVKFYDVHGGFIVSISIHNTAETEIVDLSPRIYNSRFYTIKCSDGTEYECVRVTTGNIKNLHKTHDASDPTPDTSFAVSANGKTLSITHTSMVIVTAS